jgi:eukaryotic-like serine/threonine-protein kinase
MRSHLMIDSVGKAGGSGLGGGFRPIVALGNHFTPPVRGYHFVQFDSRVQDLLMPVQVERLAEPIPGYRLLERLGGGGFGEVWKAEAPGGLLKAIKFVHGDLQTTDDEGMRAEQELKALSRVKTVRHPYILSLERFDIIEGRLIIVMELADRNLWDRFRECQTQGLPGIPREELLRYMEETAEALDLMNTQYQLQHLDIKPQNIFLVQNHVKVADFGLVKDLQGMAASVTGGVTPVYAAPETFDGWVSRFCDQYSLSIVYQEMLTGQRPFTAGNVHQLIMQHVKGKPNLAPLPAAEQEIIARALAKKPDERHACCMDMVRLLRAVAGPTNGTSRAVSMAEPPPSTPRQSRPLHQISPKAPAQQAEPIDDSHLSQQVTAIRGDGVLVPALVIGLGSTGLAALRQFRRQVRDRFGAPESLPHLRLLYIDTDPEATQSATRDTTDDRLTPGEVVLARLKRASHFLKPGDSRPRIDTWFSTPLLYRMTRNQQTGGLRALGRLAFVDNYRPIVRRLRTELQNCAAPNALAIAKRTTGLALRCNRPRIFIVCGLGGGSGSGMFIDLAYVVRETLKEIGHTQAEVVGLFLVPPAKEAASPKVARANAFAALTELNHFSTPGNAFRAQYVEREAPVQSTVAPFSRVVLLPFPDGNDPTSKATLPLAEFLDRFLLTPLGRAADTRRSECREHSQNDNLPAFHSFGMFRLSWPRRAALHRAAQRYCRHVVQAWTSKDAKPVAENVRAILQEQALTQELVAEPLIKRFQAVCERALQRSPEEAFAEVTVSVADKPPGTLNAQELFETVRKIQDLVGHPTESAVLHDPGLLEEALAKEGEGFVRDCQRKLGQFIADLIEEPGFRLAGAEEAIRQLMALFERILKHQEPLVEEIAEKATKSHERFQFLLSNIEEINKGGRRSVHLAAELDEMMRMHPKWRYQSLVLRRVTMSLTSLRGFVSDQLREISFYRLRLQELLRMFETTPSDESVENPLNSYPILPGACRTVEEALDQTLPKVTADGLHSLDQRIQTLIRQQFTALAHVCTASLSLLRKLEAAMVADMQTVVSEYFAELRVVDMYLNRHPHDTEALDVLATTFDDSGPPLTELGVPGAEEFAIVTVPPALDNKRFEKLLRQVAPSADIVECSSLDEIVFYREGTRATLAELALVKGTGREAYRQLATTENFSLHSRMDISEWQPLVSE